MDTSVQRLLTDKLYDKRKQGALELEKLVRESIANKDSERIRKIVDQLCHEYAYAVHQPHARNGGLIGLAAASIALGSDEVAQYLSEIVPPVLACFSDQDARVRYYACESMYNIAKVAKGEILVYFNSIFDALCKLAADSELSVKNGAELLDRLVKDIVSESASTYVSVLQFNEKTGHGGSESPRSSIELPTAFSLGRFIPLLEERIHVINPFTRTFLVSWLTLLDTIPDLELVHYLPSFLGGLFKFLGDPNRDVYVATQGLLDRLLNEIVKIAKIKRGLAESKRSRQSASRRRSVSPGLSESTPNSEGDNNAIEDTESETTDSYVDPGGDWIPGQDVVIDHAAILDILLKFVDPSSNKESSPTLRLDGLSKQKEEEIGIVALRWIGTFFEVAPEDILPFVPRLLSRVLPALASQSEQFRSQASSVNRALMDYIVTYHEQNATNDKALPPLPKDSASTTQEPGTHSRQQSAAVDKLASSQSTTQEETAPGSQQQGDSDALQETNLDGSQSTSDLDYAAAVNALTLQFLHEHEETRVAALAWLIMLHKKAPKKVLAFNDGTFPALLKTLSDPAEAVVTRDLQLLSQISKNSEDSYFSSFMVALLQLFSTDRKLLEIRGNLIIRQLCINLMPERIYRTLADCIEKDEDIEFASIMVQNLNNNLITAPELAELRKRLRNLDSKDGQMFFVALFRAWCYNAVATFSLCLLAQAYEQAYNLLQIFADLEMTVNMLIQIDKLVQLLESPVFTYLRLQLLEPDRYPYLYKCLYGLLMLLPQSSAFAALKNRLNSVSAIGLLHTPASMPTSARPSYVSANHPPPIQHSSFSSSTNIGTGALTSPSPHHARQRSVEKGIPLPVSLSLTSAGPLTSSSHSVVAGMSGSTLPSGPGSSTGRLGRRDPGGAGGPSEVKWVELLEKFRTTQEKARRRNERLLRGEEDEREQTRLSSFSQQSGSMDDGRILPSTSGRTGRGSGLNGFDGGRPGSALSGGGNGQKRLSGIYTGGTSAGRTYGGTYGPGQSGPTPAVTTVVERPGHKSRHSLMGKFTSGIARSSSSIRDKEKEKDKTGKK